VNAEGWSKILVLAGGIVVAVGSALQALDELRAYEDIYDESKAKDVVGHAFRFTLVAPTLANPIFWPRAIRQLGRLLASSKQAIAWAATAREHDPEQWARAELALRRARNWVLILIGSVVVIAAAALDLGHYLHEH
jgi:hypothetical protein